MDNPRREKDFSSQRDNIVKIHLTYSPSPGRAGIIFAVVFGGFSEFRKDVRRVEDKPKLKTEENFYAES